MSDELRVTSVFISRPAAILWTLLLALLLAGPARAEEKKLTLDQVADRVQTAYDKVKDLSADFEQTTRIKGRKRAKEAAGQVYFKKPGKMRWNYNQQPVPKFEDGKPLPAGSDCDATHSQVIASDGGVFWYYTAASCDVYQSQLTGAFQAKTPTTFLLGLGKLKDSFDISVPEGGLLGKDGLYRLKLKMKESQQGTDALLLLVEPKTFQIRGVVHTDFYGTRTEIRLKNIKENQNLPDSLFVFKIPKGARVIEK